MFVSVIIPCYNCEKKIAECINSLLLQKTKHKYEIITVNDGSTDKTEKIMKEINSNKVKYFSQKNSGPAKARNFGAKKAGGEIILFIDSDCVAEKNWLEEMINPFETKNVAAVQGAYITKQKEIIARFSQIEIEERYEKMKKADEIDWVGSYSAGYKKNIFDELGGFDESFPIASGEDPELSYKVAEKGYKIIFNPKAIVYHTHPASLKKYLRTKFFRAYYRPKLYSKHKTKIIKDSYTPQSLKAQIVIFYLIVLSLIIGFYINIVFLFAICLFVLHIILGANLFVLAYKKDIEVALASPIILFLRSIVFGAGLIWGKVNGW